MSKHYAAIRAQADKEFPHEGNDCVVVAAALLSGRPYAEAHYLWRKHGNRMKLILSHRHFNQITAG